MKIAIIGSKGMLGKSLKNLFEEKGFTVLSGDREECNISSYESMLKFLKEDIKYLFNCAAYTDVVKAEEEKKQAYSANAKACGILASICLDYNIHLVHFSTDFVFDGTSKIPYKEEDLPNPINYYGLSKLHGERAIIKKMGKSVKYSIFRLQWLYGDEDKNFFSRILSLAKDGQTLKIVTDELGSPCSTQFVSKTIYNIFFTKDPRRVSGKLFHLTHNDHCSRYVCGKYFLEKMGFKDCVLPDNNPPEGVLKRPKNSFMNNSKLKKISGRMGSWRKDLDFYIKELKNA